MARGYKQMSGRNEEMDRAELLQLSQSCDFLEHYHIEHTEDKITRFRGTSKSGSGCADIYVVSDPEWKEKFAAFTASEFPGSNGERQRALAAQFRGVGK
jgi:hypothetical protein